MHVTVQILVRYLYTFDIFSALNSALNQKECAKVQMSALFSALNQYECAIVKMSALSLCRSTVQILLLVRYSEI